MNFSFQLYCSCPNPDPRTNLQIPMLTGPNEGNFIRWASGGMLGPMPKFTLQGQTSIKKKK